MGVSLRSCGATSERERERRITHATRTFDSPRLLNLTL